MDIQELFHSYRDGINHFFNGIDLQEVEEVLNAFKKCSGLLVFSGVGKSGLVAQKIATTMTSTGTRALFLSPVEAMHGDIGVVSANDLFIAVSKSGETEELLHLLPYVRNKGAKVIAFVSNPESRIAKGADITLTLPVEKELCPFNLAPTISTTAQLILGDVLAIALMKAAQFSLDQYAMNHPSGTIGKRITLKVEDLMLKGEHIPRAKAQTRIIDALHELSNKRAGCLLIVDDQEKLLGIFTDGDLRRALQKYGDALLQKPLEEVMTKEGRTIGPQVLAWEAMKIMEGSQKSPIMMMPVINENRRVLGLLKMHDIIQSGL
jgi:arabinose-5-phosphate isomerase